MTHDIALLPLLVLRKKGVADDSTVVGKVSVPCEHRLHKRRRL